MSFTRRELLKTSALASSAAVLPSWLAGPLLAQADKPLVRYDVNGLSDEAKAAVAAYRKGVAAMKARRPHDPTSWIFQANIHSWPGQFGQTATDPEKEFRDTFSPNATLGLPASEKARREMLARNVWGTCTHSDPAVRFLPWHRVYLYFFERILRAAAGLDAGLSIGLPYWNWTKDRTLPLAFREPVGGSQSGNDLYWDLRNEPVNRLSNPARINSVLVAIDEILDIPDFSPGLTPNADLGFNDQLEGGPHGQVHVWVRDFPRGMGFFEEAARDPIFWPHHCNIDRLWTHWKRDSNHNEPVDVEVTPGLAWAKVGHRFVDVDGQERTLTTEQVLVAARIIDRGYIYDDVPSPAGVAVVTTSPAGSANPSSSGGVGPSPAKPEVIAQSGPVTVAGRTRVELTIATAGPGPAAPTGTTPPQGPRVLVLRDLSVDQPSASVYGVYLNLPDNAEPDPQGPFFAGTFNVFNAQAAGRTPAFPPGADRHGPAGGGHLAVHGTVNRRLGVAEVLRRQQQSGLWQGGNVSVTLAPLPTSDGEPVPPQAGGPGGGGSGPRIGAIELLGR